MTEPDNGTTAELRARFAAELRGSSEWLAAFASVPRHHFTPTFHAKNEHGKWYEVGWDDPEYLGTVYSNTALTTQLNGQGIPTSSSSEPALMLAMLDALDAHPGHTVFELGTGTGYNAALLSSRLGGDHVVSVDVDPDLTHLARSRLAKLHHHPTLFTGDGALGYPARGPYDRVIATAGLRSVPAALMGQVSEGAVIVAPIGYGVARLTVTGDGEASGRYLPQPALFMPRRTPGKAPAFDTARGLPPQATRVPVARVLARLRFPLSLALPGYSSCSWRDEDGGLSAIGLWTADGSTVMASVNGDVRQTGPRRLWETVEELAATFPDGEPAREDFGVTVTPGGQRVWHRSPGGPAWSLPST